MSKISACVWTEDIEPEVFEYEWQRLVKEYGLENHAWLSQLYDIRRMWIPAYFRDLFMGSLMKTTSRSESVNSAFTSIMNPHSNLVEFYTRFESCLDTQRYNQVKNHSESEHKHPGCTTQLPIEKHAADIYTIPIFKAFQEQFNTSLLNCVLEGMKDDKGVVIFSVNVDQKTSQVVFEASNQETSCSCKFFQRRGIPCSHMIYIWNLKGLKSIPEQYILQRWCKNAVRSHDLGQPSHTIDKKRTLNLVWAAVHSCIMLAQTDIVDLDDFRKYLLDYQDRLESKRDVSKTDTASSKLRDVEMLLGVSIPTEITIKPPKVSKNKGTGVHLKGASKDKRLKSDKEKAVEKHQKPKRLCRGCNKYEHHDIRNCPQKKAT